MQEKTLKKQIQRHLQKQRIKREYAKARRAGQAAKNTKEAAANTASFTTTVAKKVQELAAKHAGLLVTIGIFALLLVMIMICISSCGAMFSEGMSTTMAGSYMSVPAEIDALTVKLKEEYAAGKNEGKKHRILITGCPMGGATMKVVKAIEENGGVVVAFENCSGAKSVDRLIDENDPDIYEAIARRYLNIGCSVMTPNPNRFELLNELIDEYQVEAVVEMTLQACHTYNVEAGKVGRFVREEKKIPYLHVETDYSQSDVGQLNTRIAALIEML